MRSRLHASTSFAALWLGLACAATAPAQTTASDFDALVVELPALYRDGHYLKLEDVLASLGRSNPTRAIAAIKSLKPELPPRASEVVFGAWARQDLRAAFAWARDNEPAFLGRVQFIRALAAGRDLSILEETLIALGASQTPGAIQPEARGGRGMQSVFFVQLAAREWAKVDPEAIIAWARTATERKFSGDIQAKAFTGIIFVLAQKSPTETFQWLETGIFVDPALDPTRNGPRGFYQAFVEGVVVGSSVEAAEAYFQDKPAKPDYAMAYSALAKALAKTAPERIERWVAAIEDPFFKAGAVIEPVNYLRETRPKLAADLFVKYSRNLSTPRGQADLRAMMLAWAEKDAPAALAFLETAPRLTPENRAALKAAIAPNP